MSGWGLDFDGDHFGRCPDCGCTDGFLDVGPNHWFVCHACETCWHVGANLFSFWREENEADWRANEATIRGYREIEPVHDAREIGRLLGFDVDALTRTAPA